MTIRVKVTNEDSRPEAVVIVNAINGKTGDRIAGSVAIELAGGQTSNDLYVYPGHAVLIEEVTRAAVSPETPPADPAPPADPPAPADPVTILDPPAPAAAA